MKRILIFTLLILGLILQAEAKQKILLGRTEAVKILPQNIKVDAKLDTGAYQSSLHAEDIQEHMFKGKRYVTFKYPKGKEGQFHEFDLPIYKYAKIKKRSADIGKDGKTYNSRPVVKLKICLAGKIKELDVNLTNRAHFKQKMLIGRLSMTRFSVMIDPSQEFLTLPNCKE